jgi:Skp family chaperone for outer membrane proteins
MLMRRSLLPVAVLALTAGLTAPAAHAQSASPTKVAVVDTFRVLKDMQEFKDSMVKWQNDGRTFQGENEKRKADLVNLQNTRDQLKPDSAQYSEANQKLLRASIEYENWGRITQIELQRSQKQQVRAMFERIQAAAADVAKQQGFDVVVAAQKPDMAGIDNPQVTIDNLKNAISQFNVLYADPKNDVTNMVIATLDAKYKSGGGAPTAAGGK